MNKNVSVRRIIGTLESSIRINTPFIIHPEYAYTLVWMIWDLARAIRALKIIILTPHIAKYLAKNDPKALKQCKDALSPRDYPDIDDYKLPEALRKT